MSTRCPSCRRPVTFYVDRIGYVHAYCPEEERLHQSALGPCVPIVRATVELPPPRVRAQRDLFPRPIYRGKGSCPQRRRKTPGLPPQPTHEQRMEGLRRYYLRKHGVAA
jgi:hypothetical protein